MSEEQITKLLEAPATKGDVALMIYAVLQDLGARIDSKADKSEMMFERDSNQRIVIKDK